MRVFLESRSLWPAASMRVTPLSVTPLSLSYPQSAVDLNVKLTPSPRNPDSMLIPMPGYDIGVSQSPAKGSAVTHVLGGN